MDHDTYKSPLAGTPQPKRQVSKVPKPIRPIGGSAYVPRPQPSPSATPAPSQPHAADTRSDVPPEWVSLADPPEWIAAVHDIGAEAVRRDLLLAVAHGPLRFHHRIVGINPGISRLVPGLRVSAEGDCNRVVVRSWETVDAHWNGNAAGTVAGPAKEGRATRVVGLCGVVFLSLMGCQQSQPAPVMEEDLLACQQHPENHSVQFCDRITQAYRIYMGTAGSNSDQNAPTQTTRNKPRVARLASSERRVQSRDDGSPQPSKQLGANPFQARVATVYIAESFINEQLRQRLSNFELVKDLRMQLDPDSKRIFLEGLLRVPEVEMRSINLDPQQGEFRFRASLRARATPEGYLILEFPLNETYFYPKSSQGLESDRVIVPVQLMPLAIASIRNYLAALSGDFSGFDRRTHTIRVVIQSYEKARAATNDPGEQDYWTNQVASYNLQLQALPIERRQLEQMSKHLGPIVDFLSAKDLNVNEALRANKNALLLHIRLSDLVPYLRDVDLGGVRLVRDKVDRPGENFLALDINAALGQIAPATDSWRLRRPRKPMAKPPSLVVRLHQDLFVSMAILEAERKTISDKVDNLDIQMRDDGLHVSGRYRGLGLPVPFDAFVDLVTVQTDVFEVQVKGLEVAGLDVHFLTGSVLNLLRNLLDHALEGRCTFEDIQQTADHERALRVHVGINKEGAPTPLVPAFPTLHLKSVEVQEREFILRLGLQPG